MSRYDLHANEEEFEPGSDDKVLCNLLGIVDPLEMGLIESQELALAQETFYDELEFEHQFLVKDLLDMHRQWLGQVYPFAGKIRRVNVGKDGFQFAAVQFLEPNLEAFEKNFLRVFTPCQEAGLQEVATAMAKVHGEFVMLHPFREGNGRLGRWLADVMAAQAGLPLPLYAFEERDGNGFRAQYLSAVKKAVLMEYEELSRFFAEALSRALDEAAQGH